VTQADEKHLTLVCYRSGYGGDFLCALLDKALGNSQLLTRDANNRYWFNNYVFSTFNYQIKSLHHIFSYYYDQDSVQVIDSLVGKIDWADEIKKIYDMCYDPDESYFIENVYDYIKTGMNLPYEYNVGNLHYTGEFQAFDLRRVHENMSVIFLKAEDPLHYQYFHAFSQIKTNFKVIKNSSAMKKENFDWKPLPYASVIDAGKLFFEDSLDDKISSVLSEVVGKRVDIDVAELKRYRADNVEVLKRHFGDNFANMDASAFRAKKLELYARMAQGEDHQ